MVQIIPSPDKLQLKILPKELNIEYFTGEELIKIFSYLEEQMQVLHKTTILQISKNLQLIRLKRYELLFYILYYTGARITEALQLRPVDFDFETHTVRFIKFRQKSRREYYKFMPMDEKLENILLNYFKAFYITESNVYKLFNYHRTRIFDVMKKIGTTLNIKVKSVKFRNTFIVAAISHNIPLRDLKLWLGHSPILSRHTYDLILSIHNR